MPVTRIFIQVIKMEGLWLLKKRDKHAGFMLFLVIFAVALLTRFIAAVMYKGYETDMNCFYIME